MSHKSTSQEAAVEVAHDDDLIVVPKGTSRLKFILILALTIFVLLIFTVGDVVQSGMGGIFGGGGRNPTYMSWTHPDTGEKLEVDSITFQKRMQTLNAMSSIGAYRPINFRDQRARVSSNDAAMFFILDKLAEDAGIEVSDTEHRQRLLQLFGSSETLRLAARRESRLRRSSTSSTTPAGSASSDSGGKGRSTAAHKSLMTRSASQ